MTTTTALAVKAVYKAIADVSSDISKSGISKDRKNLQQGYSFRGIDDVYNALAPMLSKHGLVILPRILSRDCVERHTKQGGILFSVTVEAEFDFVAVSDGSVHVARTYGEAMDSGDKATNKAMSAAYKYVTFQTFCIPTEGDNDADAKTHELVAEPEAPKAPEGFSEWEHDLTAVAQEGTAALQAAWKASRADLRTYLTQHDNNKWMAIKAIAVKVRPPEVVNAS